MNSKTKFKKLQLPKSSRHKTNSQISKFFSTSQNEECSSSSSLSELPTKTGSMYQLENSNENSTNSCTSEDIVLIVSDDEDDTTLSNNNELLSSKLSINEQLPNTELKPDNEANKLPRKTVVSKFFDNSFKDDDDFENPPPIKKKPNKITKPKKSAITKSIPKTKKKKQITIKNAFIKNEEIFSELMAQHSIADDINPDDLQMALAMSISEATSNGICVDEDSKESLACCSGNSNKIRDRLKEYGFKTSSNSGDYDIAYFLPGKKKSKWANKFTALTLRNPDRQKEKLNHRIEKFLNQQDILKNKSNSINNINEQYLISSHYLNKLKSENVSIKLEFENVENVCVEMFYVNELFETSTIKAGYLMKDLNEIPGRDFSPKQKNKKEITITSTEIFEKELEISKLDAICKNENLSIALDFDDINSKLIENQKEINENETIFNKMSENLVKPLEIDLLLSPLHKKAKFDNPTETEPYHNKTENKLIVDRVSSPDLFADFETDTSQEKSSNDNEPKSNLDTNFNVETFENYSSDEVKIAHDGDKRNIETTPKDNSNNTSNIIISKTSLSTSINDDDLIDLTQDSDSNSISYNTRQISIQNLKNDQNSCQLQLDCIRDDSIDDCIILTDDEVNYSMKIANNTIKYNNNIDLALSSCSDIEEDKNYDINTKNYNENDDTKNFSFMNLIESNLKINKNLNLSINENMNLEDNKNISYLEILEENENGEISPVQSPFKSQISLHAISSTNTTPNKNNQVSNESFNEFLSPAKITPTKLFRDQSRFSIYFSPTKSATENSANKLNLSSDSKRNSSQSENEYDEMSFNLTKLRKKYGINEIKRKSLCRKTLSESFITPTKSHNEDDLKFKRFSSSSKFKEFIEKDEENENFPDIDEIDMLVHGNEFKTSIFNKPKDLDKLLSADIKTKPFKSTESVSYSDNKLNEEEPKEISSNGRIYLVSTQNIPAKLDYKRIDSPTRLKELYKYGLKPLKKKQAVIMLEYIYNQTHPIIVNNNSQETFDNFTQDNREIIQTQNNIINYEIEKNNQIDNNHKFDNFKLNDCCGTTLLVDDGFIFGESKDESYFFQTNISKKIATALLPLHVAWYNLVKSNYNLKESILHYEPIDLQEIYLFLKRIGYRYDPKDIKKFFDYHCIIFRYDIQDKNTNRHIRKKKSFTISQKSKQLNFDWML